METIHSSYPYFLKEYDKKLHVDKNHYINQIRFGEKIDAPIDSKICVLIPDDKAKTSILNERWKGMVHILQIAGYERFVVQAREEDGFTHDAGVDISFVTTDDLPEIMADAGIIITEKLLPGYYVRKNAQKVIHLVLDSKKYLDATRSVISERVFSHFLQVSAVVLCDGSSEEAFCSKLHLYPLYRGIVCSIGSVEAFQGCLESLLNGNDSKTPETVSKKQILAYVNWNEDDEARENVIAFCSGIDQKVYDVTLVFNRAVEKEWLKQTLEDELDENIRVVCRMGGEFCGKAEDVCNLQFCMKHLLDTEKTEEASAYLNQDILRNDFRRMFGEAVFDTFFYFGKFNRLWISIAKFIPADRKILFRASLDLSEKDELRRKNKATLDESIFDLVYFSTAKNKRQHENPEKALVGSLPLAFRKREGERLPRKLTNVQGKEYYVYGQHGIGFGNDEMVLLPRPDNHMAAYIVNEEVSDVDLILEVFAGKKHDDVRLYVIGQFEEPVSTVKNRYDSENVIVINDFFVSNLASLETYMDWFDGYITTDGQDVSKWRLLSEVNKKKILLVDGVEIKNLSGKLLSENESYEDYCKRVVEKVMFKAAAIDG